MSQEAEALGLSVSDAALKEDFQRAFAHDGKYDREIAERYLNRTGLGVASTPAQHRRDMLLRNFSRFVASPVRVSDGDVRDEILRNDTKLTLRVATASKAALREHITVTPEEAKALLAKEPERVKGAYQMRIADYSREEQIRARHMLFTGEDAEAQALKARARIDAGESFAEVAKQVSADEATRAEGGELGTLPARSHDAELRRGRVRARGRQAERSGEDRPRRPPDPGGEPRRRQPDPLRGGGGEAGRGAAARRPRQPRPPATPRTRCSRRPAPASRS